jgi:hypothetical protein
MSEFVLLICEHKRDCGRKHLPAIAEHVAQHHHEVGVTVVLQRDGEVGVARRGIRRLRTRDADPQVSLFYAGIPQRSSTASRSGGIFAWTPLAVVSALTPRR